MTGDVWLNLGQVCEATGVPIYALTRMAVDGTIPAVAMSPDKARKSWRVKLSDLDAVRAGYVEYKAQEAARRGHSSTGKVPLKARVERLEWMLSTLVDQLGVELGEFDPPV